MPLYHYEGDYTVYCFAKNPYTLRNENKKLNEYKFESGNMKGIRGFYNNNLKKYNFSPSNIDLYKLNEEDFFTLRDKEGNILAACALWDQNDYKQYIITNYSGILKYVKKLPTNLLGYPNFPVENIPLNYASLSLFFVEDMDVELAEYFLRKVIQASKKYDLLMLGLFESHPFNSIFNRIKHIKYSSRLYRVNWEDRLLELDGRPLNIEVGLL